MVDIEEITIDKLINEYGGIHIRGYEDYIVLPTSEIFSIKFNTIRKLVPQILHKNGKPSAYRQIVVRQQGKDPARRLIHRIVAETFIPNPENKPQVNHKDGNGSNNHVDNLEWCTGHENMAHSFRILKRRMAVGEKVHLSKLTEEEVIMIRKIYPKGHATQQELAKIFNCHPTTIYSVLSYITWKHI